MFTFPGGADLAPLPRVARMRVRAFSSIHANRHVVNGRGSVRFSGRLGLKGATVPHSGKLVDLSPEVALEAGHLHIAFVGAEDLLSKLFELSQAASNDFDGFRAAAEPAEQRSA